MAYTVRPITLKEARPLIAKHHYSGESMPLVRFSFGLFLDDELCGAVTFSPPVDYFAAQWADLELSRLALTHNRRNEASRLVSGAVRLLGDVCLVSYADPAQRHTGTVYRASGWNYHGLSRPSTRRRGETWHRTGMKHRYSLGSACPWPVLPFVPLTEAQTRKAVVNAYDNRRAAATVAERSKVYRARKLVDLKIRCGHCSTAFKASRRSTQYCSAKCRVAAHRAA
ncbi:MAG: hypothetical protein ABJ360_13290 [Roseobacter sp.]|uniref:Mom family adenine methylcarbamoylation protein n=1 Tax=Tateyamaria sp. TaxID=1929288 RepID=UPI00328B6845